MNILLLLNPILFFRQHGSTTNFSSLLVYLIYYTSVVQGKSPLENAAARVMDSD